MGSAETDQILEQLYFKKFELIQKEKSLIVTAALSTQNAEILNGIRETLKWINALIIEFLEALRGFNY